MDDEMLPGNDTLIGAMREVEAEGYEAQQVAQESGDVRCGACDVATPAPDFEVDGYRRLEGTSDADDLMLLTWSACPSCGSRGTLVLGFGPNASEADVAVQRALDLPDDDPEETD